MLFCNSWIWIIFWSNTSLCSESLVTLPLVTGTPGWSSSYTLHPTQASLSSTALSHVPIAPLLLFVVFQSCVMLHGQPRDSAIRMSLCALGRYDILREFLQYRARIDQHVWILEWKGTSGLDKIPSGCTCAKAMPCYLQALQSPHCVLGLFIYPEFIHILESCPRNVYNLACSTLQLHCWKNPPASKSLPVPAQRLLSVAAGSAGAWPPVRRCLLTLVSIPARAGSASCGTVCIPPASPAASLGLKERASRWITPHTLHRDPLLHCLDSPGK